MNHDFRFRRALLKMVQIRWQVPDSPCIICHELVDVIHPVYSPG